MTYKPLASGISITTQLTPQGIDAAKAAGIRTIINNRPDNEEPGQPSSAQLAARAKAAGLDYRYIPVVPGQFGDGQVDAFREAIEQCDKPVLAFCKSGMRAASLWALAQAGKLPTADILRQATACGYDLGPLASRIDGRA